MAFAAAFGGVAILPLISFAAGFLVILLFFARKLRDIGAFTLSDYMADRFNSVGLRAFTAVEICEDLAGFDVCCLRIEKNRDGNVIGGDLVQIEMGRRIVSIHLGRKLTRGGVGTDFENRRFPPSRTSQEEKKGQGPEQNHGQAGIYAMVALQGEGETLIR